MNAVPRNPGGASQGEAISNTKIECDHCRLPVPPGLIESGQSRQFCCNGCKFAFQLIHEHRLEAYYQMLDKDSAAGVEKNLPASVADDFSEFDEPGFLERYGKRVDEAHSETCLLLDGIHCAACIWLLEKMPSILPGVVFVQLNWSKRTARIRWNHDQLTLSQIAQCFATLGYRPHAIRESEKERLRQQENRQHLVRIGVAAALAGNNMLIAAALYFGMFSQMSAGISTLFRVGSCLLGIVALLGPGRVFLKTAWSAIRTRTPHMDLPIALGLTVGTIAGVVNTVRGLGEIYFDSLSVLICLLLIGRWLQFRQQNRAVDAVEMLHRLTPRRARKRVDGRSVEVFVDTIVSGDVLEVKAGDLFAVDGKLLEGTTSVNESMLTGESRSVDKSEGSVVFAGTQNLVSTVTYMASGPERDSRLVRLVELMESASEQKPQLVQWANRIGAYFVLAVLLAACVTMLVWFTTDAWMAIDRTVALLIVACPCALALATPLAISVALGHAAKSGIMVKGGDVLQYLSQPGMIWLDKTGTLTDGKMEVLDFDGSHEWLAGLAELERSASHPVGRALHQYASLNQIEDSDEVAFDAIETLPEGGLLARRGDQTWLVGTRKLLLQHSVTFAKDWDARASEYLDQRLSPCWVAVDGEVEMLFAVGDQLRNESSDAVTRLQQRGWEIGILSGDHRSIVQQVGHRLGLPEERCVGGVTPEEKLRAIQESMETGQTVVMVGDGVNDSAALAAASVGIAVHGGAEASLAAAPVYLAEEGLSPILRLLAICRSSRRTMRVTLAISLAYNLLFASLAFLGWINPLVAAILMPISSLTVVALSMSSGKTAAKPLKALE